MYHDMQTINPTKLGLMKFLVFWLYLAAAICIVVFLWSAFSGRKPGSSPEFIFLMSASGLGFLGLIGDILCDLSICLIRNEQRQELILEELKRSRT